MNEKTICVEANRCAEQGARPCKAKSFVHDDGGEWQVFDLRKERCDGLPVVSRSKFRSVCRHDVPHVHPQCVEIFFCLKGCVRYEVGNGKVEKILPGQIFLSRPDQPHCRVSSPKGMCLYRAIFEIPKPSGRVLGLSKEDTRLLVEAFTGFRRRVSTAPARVRAAFERLFAACETGRRGSAFRRLNVKSAALELLLALAEAVRQREPVRGAANPRVEELVRRIDGDPAADYPISFLSGEAALSPVALNTAFKRLTGMTPHAYVLDARVRCARADLARGMSITAVAKRYRFPSAAHFATVFRRIVGLSPHECRPK